MYRRVAPGARTLGRAGGGSPGGDVESLELLPEHVPRIRRISRPGRDRIRGQILTGRHRTPFSLNALKTAMAAGQQATHGPGDG
jgi:hypothetical protein